MGIFLRDHAEGVEFLQDIAKKRPEGEILADRSRGNPAMDQDTRGSSAVCFRDPYRPDLCFQKDHDLGLHCGKGFSNRRQEIKGSIDNRPGIEELAAKIVTVIRVCGEDHFAAGHKLYQMIRDGSGNPHLSQGSGMNPYSP
jgi:hypothetical protein